MKKKADIACLHGQMVNEGKLFECHGCGSKKFVWYSE